eukprot:scaffold13478_cov132-Cylindrotheca_fusiformis.AAC.30
MPSVSSLNAVYSSPDSVNLINSEVDNFRPGPQISIGSLKLNWFGALWGVVGVSLGFLWWLGLAMCQVFQFLTRQKFDPQWRLPVEVGHLWGTTVLWLTNCYPVISGKENLKTIYRRDKDTKKRKPVMFVANHSSWMDIYFVGISIGWHNYKMIAKKELLKVPFLSKSLKVAKHILLDRSDFKSQLKTYKAGVKYLKDGVNLVTYAEGTRSADGRLGPFKKGAFRMATAVGANIVPVSISYAHKVHPKDYVLPVRMGRRIPASIHIGEPIETEGMSEDALMELVWEKIAEKLPDSQKPIPGTPKSAVHKAFKTFCFGWENSLDLAMRRNAIRLLPPIQKRCLSTAKGPTKSKKKDFEYCVDLVQNRDREGYLCGLLMPRSARRSYFAIRAFNVEVASIKDARKSEGSEFDAASLALKIRVQWWYDALNQVYGDTTPVDTAQSGITLDMATSCWNNPVVRVLKDAVEQSNLTKRFLERLLDAREADLDVKQPETITESIDYAENIFSSLLYLSLETTNVREESSDVVAQHAGIGIGLITALRGARFRFARGECAIPRDLIPTSFPYYKFNLEDPQAEMSEEETKMLRESVFKMAQIASSHLSQARDMQSAVPKQSRPCLLPVVPALHYLSKLEKAEYNIFDDSLLEPDHLKSLALLGRTWLSGVF